MITAIVTLDDIMVDLRTTEASKSMIVTGSTVVVVGIIFLVTITMAFVMMIAFGAAVTATGLILLRRSRSQVQNAPESGLDR